MNKQTRNLIAREIVPYTGHYRCGDDALRIIERIKDAVRRFGYIVDVKVSEEHNGDLASKCSAYKIVDRRTEKKLDAQLVIDEYFGNEAGDTYEIIAYVS